MTKCKIAMEGTDCGKVCCCFECDDRKTCENVCGFVENKTFENAEFCQDAIQEGTEVTIFEEKALVVIQAIANIAKQKKELEEQDKSMREQLEAAMEQYGVKSFENDLIKITYVEPTTRTSVDSTKLKKKYPDIFTECSKTSEVKGSVRITVK